MGFDGTCRAAAPGRRLRALLRPDRTLMAPGAFSPMAARLVEQAGFEAVYMPGGGTALDRLGVADIGLLTLSEMVDNAAAIAHAVSVPVIADADTGFGNALNVQRTVREYERAGVAAIHLEDQQFPKRCGHLQGKSLVSQEEAAAKIRAAVEARTDPDFMIIARCDALALSGMGETVRRCHAYLEAGADMLFVESPVSEDDIARIPLLIPGRHLFNMSASGKTPMLSAQDLSSLGYQLMILPNFTTLVAIKAMSQALTEMRKTGTAATIVDHCASFTDFTRLGGLPDLLALEQKYKSADPA